MAVERTVLEFSPAQDRFARVVLEGNHLYPCYGGGIGGGKTVVGLGLLFLLCKIFPGSRWAVTRKNLPVLRRNTLPSIQRWGPAGFLGDVHKTEWRIRCSNGSEILLFPESLKDDPELKRFDGLEVNGFLLDQAEELGDKTFGKCIERAGRWRLRSGPQPPPYVIATVNPARNWVRRAWYDPHVAGRLERPYYYQRALLTDNPHLSQEYVDALEQLRTVSPRTYARMVLGDWDALDEPDQLIPYEDALACVDVEHEPGQKRLGVDYGRTGDSATVAPMDGNAVGELEVYTGTKAKPFRNTDCANVVQRRIIADSIDPDNVAVDVVGWGAGTVDDLVAMGYPVFPFSAGSGAIPMKDSEYRFANLRSQAWWLLAMKIREHTRKLPDDPKLREDLVAPKVSITDKVIAVESKDSIRKRLGRSTDRGDAVVMADFDLRPSAPVSVAFAWA